MPDASNPQVVDTISTTNLKTLAEGTAFATNNVHQIAAQTVGLAMQNAVTTQQRMNDVGVQASQGFTNNMHNLDLKEASAISTVKGADLASIASQLATATAAIQQLAKIAQSTPPQTAQSG